jgi:TPR repeat protein
MAFFGIVILAVVAGALMLRVHDAPYLSYQQDPRAALDGLKHLAQNGDGFAAYLVAGLYERSALGQPDPQTAAAWYLTSARNGEIRAVSRYIGLMAHAHPTEEQCRAALSMLELAGRAGELNAVLALGSYYESGTCTAADPAKAAQYYMGAARIDGRLSQRVDAAVAGLDSDTVRGLTPRPESFDADKSTVLAQFLAAAPRLAASAPH